MVRQQAEHGWMAKPGTAAEVVCGWQDRDIHADRRYLDALVQRYSRRATRAIIWTNPARDCDMHISDYRHNAQQLGLEPTAVYDRKLFTDAFHLNTAGAARNADALATYLLSLGRVNTTAILVV
jgi:lysophospholipase L1-like esterase